MGNSDARRNLPLCTVDEHGQMDVDVVKRLLRRVASDAVDSLAGGGGRQPGELGELGDVWHRDRPGLAALRAFTVHPPGPLSAGLQRRHATGPSVRPGVAKMRPGVAKARPG